MIPNAHDTAAFILDQTEPISPWRMHKLLFYGQAWHTVWKDELMFKNEIHAWANGPVVVDLYPFHKGTYMVDSWPFGDPDKVDSDRRETLENIIHAYGHLSNSYLTDTVRSEMAYKEARDGLRADERVEQEMTADMICYHYMALDLNPTALPVEELNPEYY